MGRQKVSKEKSFQPNSVKYRDNVSPIQTFSDKQLTSFEKNLPKYIEFASWVMW